MSGQGSITVNQKKDAWTYVILETNFVTNLAFTGVVVPGNRVPGLFFTPLANKRYEIEGKLIVQSTALTTGPRPGAEWPTAGVVINTGWYIETGATSTGTAFQRFNGGPFSDQISSTGVPIINAPFHCHLEGILVTNNLIAGNYQILLTSEIAGSDVSMMANSFIRFREY